MNDLEDMSIDELRALRRAIDKAISSFEARQRKAAKAAAEEAAGQHGYTIAQLLGGRAGRSSPAATTEPAAAKYANPDKPDETWSGRGRRPQWVRTILDAGGALDDLAI